MASERSKRVARARAATPPKQLPVKNSVSPKPSKIRATEKVTPRPAVEPPVPEVETVDYSSMTKSQLQDLLKERGVAYLPRSTNRILIGLLENV